MAPTPEYINYIRFSPVWQMRRIQALDRAGWVCETLGCGGIEGLEVQHIAYDRLGSEQPEDMVVVCRDCREEAFDRILENRPSWVDRMDSAMG